MLATRWCTVLEELADIIEVCRHLAKSIGFGTNALDDKVVAKYADKGGFDEGFVLKGIKNSD